MEAKAIIVGGFHEVIELCEESGVSILGIMDSKLQGSYYGYPVLGTDDDASLIREKYAGVPVIITPDAPAARAKLAAYYRSLGFGFLTLVSPDAKVSKYSEIGEGCIIQSGVTVSAGTKIGSFVKLNVGSTVMHDNRIGSFVTVAPRAVSLGRVTIEDMAYIGANSTVLPDLTIGEKAVVGAGAVVTKDVKASTVVKGVPAK